MEQSGILNLNELSIKWKSKKELYDVMLNDCDVLLPPIRYANAAYMRGVISGKVLVSCAFIYLRVQHVSRSITKLIKVPQIDGVTTEDIMAFAMKHFDLHSYLPKYNKRRNPNRPWLCNLSNIENHLTFSLHNCLKAI